MKNEQVVKELTEVKEQIERTISMLKNVKRKPGFEFTEGYNSALDFAVIMLELDIKVIDSRIILAKS